MTFQNWSDSQFGLVIIGAFIVGSVLVSSLQKPVIKEVTKEVPGVCDYSDWKTLKEVDDKAFKYCADFAGLASDGFTAISNLDTVEVNNIVRKINSLNDKIETVATERQILLGKLNY